MAKEYVWDVIIEGEDHRISCVLSGNRYVLYVDEEHLTNIYRQSVSVMSDGFEETVTIHGKECFFIVWDEKPDLVVDGVMLSRDMDYQKALVKRRKDFTLVYRIVFWFGVGLLALAALMAVVGLSRAVWDDDIVFFSIAGAWMVIYGHSRSRRLTLPENSPIMIKENDKGANSK